MPSNAALYQDGFWSLHTSQRLLRNKYDLLTQLLLNKRTNISILTRLLSRLNVFTNISGSRWMPTQQPLTKIFVAWGITAGDISYNYGEMSNRRGKSIYTYICWHRTLKYAPQNSRYPILPKIPRLDMLLIPQ